MTTFIEYIRATVGTSNWVVFARRTKRIVEKYGDDVVVFTPKRYKELRRKYEIEHPGER